MSSKNKQPVSELPIPDMLVSLKADDWKPKFMNELLERQYEKGFIGMATKMHDIAKKLQPAANDCEVLCRMNPKAEPRYISTRNETIKVHCQELYEQFVRKCREVSAKSL